MILPPGKNFATKRIAASLLEKIKILQFNHPVLPTEEEENKSPTHFLFLPVDTLEGEERKLEQLYLDKSFRPDHEGLMAEKGRLSALIRDQCCSNH